jgi:MbtH protein
MCNLFEDRDGIFVVMVNSECEYSLWPDFIDVPEGWTRVFGPDVRDACLDYVEANWLEMRLRGVIDALERDKESNTPA